MNRLKRLFKRERVLFMDLDGTLIETKSGKTFPEDINDWKWKGGIIRAICRYNPTHLFIVTNQGGVEKGYFTKKDFYVKIELICDKLRYILPDIVIDYSVCFNSDKNNEMRKPNTGMLESFYHDYIMGYDFNKKRALMVGDASGLTGQFSDSDYMCAKNFGIKYLDVSYFIRWGNPCASCNVDECFYCDEPDLGIDYWIESFISDYERSV